MEQQGFDTGPTTKESLQEAKALENNEPKAAIDIYLKLLKRNKHLAIVYNRLMIVYRKQKMPKQEVAIIDKAIKAFSELHQPVVKGSIKVVVTKLSKSLSRSLGLVDKKGVPLYDAEPIAKWKRRKALLERRMSKS